MSLNNSINPPNPPLQKGGTKSGPFSKSGAEGTSPSYKGGSRGIFKNDISTIKGER